MVEFRAAQDLSGAFDRDEGEKRRHQRVRIALKGRYMLADRREFNCLATDMSPGGVSLVAPVRGEMGSRVIVYLEEIGRLEGIISRHTGAGFAMKLHATPAKRERLAEQLTWLANRQELGLPEDRRHDRLTPKRLRTTITPAVGPEHWAIIIDVSRSGAAVRTDLLLEIGAIVTVGQTPARVVRKVAGGIAVQFLRLIPIERFDEDLRL